MSLCSLCVPNITDIQPLFPSTNSKPTNFLQNLIQPSHISLLPYNPHPFISIAVWHFCMTWSCAGHAQWDELGGTPQFKNSLTPKSKTTAAKSETWLSDVLSLSMHSNLCICEVTDFVGSDFFIVHGLQLSTTQYSGSPWCRHPTTCFRDF